MTDYTMGTGSGGIMLIRDQGYMVEFHIQAGFSSTFVGTPGFGTNAYVDGAWRGLPNVANYSNREWRYLGAHAATYNQSVCFHINSSGTSGFGGPTDFWQYIQRATVPAAPTPVGIDQITHTDFRYIFSGNSDGGSPIREWQIGYGYDPNNVQYTMSSGGTSTVGGFWPGSTVYVWSRGRNDVGWGPWSTRSSVRTLPSGLIKVAGTWREYVLYVKIAGAWRAAVIYNKVTGQWKATSS